MSKNNRFIQSFLNALGTAVYIGLVSWLMFSGERWFANKPDMFLMPVFMLMLLVISATVTGFLVLGKPAMMYYEGAKREAVSFLFLTLGWLVILAVISFIILIAS